MADYDTDGSSALAPNDPYRGMSRSDTRPDLKVIKGGKDTKDGKDKSEGARGNLADSEKNAVANPVSMMEGGAEKAKDAEQNQSFGPRFSGSGLNPSKRKGGRVVGFRKGPMIMILTMLLGGGGMAMIGQGLAPFGTIARGIAEFNSNHTGMRSRSKYYTRYMMDTTRNKALTKYGVFSGERFKLSPALQRKLAKNNIQYEETTGVDGRPVRTLVFTDDDGSKIPIVTKQSDMDNLADSYKTGKAPPMLLDDAIAKNNNFFRAQEKATRTVKGHIAGWFDNLSEAFHKRISNSRNRFDDTKKDATDEDIQGDAKRTGMDEDSDNSEGNETETTKDDPNTSDDESTKVRETGDDSIKRGMKQAELVSSLNAKVAKVAAGADLACMVLKSFGAINMAIAAINLAQIINFATGFFEAVQRTQAGEGGSELAYYMNGLTQAGVTKDLKGNTVSETGSAFGSPAINSLFGGPSVSQNDPMAQKYNVESISILGNSNVGGVEDSVFQSALGNLQSTIGAAGNTIAAFQACAVAQTVGSVAGLIADALLFFTTMGIGNAIKALFQGFAETLLKSMAQGVVMGIVSAIIPQLAEMLAMDVITNMAGQDAGYMISSAFNVYQGRQHRAVGGAGGDADAVNRMNAENRAAVAEEAKYDRLNRSPFDVTSENTFMGSIVHSLIPVANSMSYAPSLVTGIGNLVGSALTSIVPAAGAAAENSTYVSGFNQDCPNLSAFDLVGDAYCNPYHTTDYSTMEMDAGDVMEGVNQINAVSVDTTSGTSTCYSYTSGGVDYYRYYKSTTLDLEGADTGNYVDLDDDCWYDKEFTNEGNTIINPKGELATFIVACTLRESQYGLVDANVQSWISAPTGDAGLDAAINMGVGVIPLIGDATSILQVAAENENLTWNSGEACVDSPENPHWEKNKKYQRYLEDQRLLEAYDLVDESSQVAIIEKHYEEHPLDTSYEGVIARYSGMSKDQVIAVLDLGEYVRFLAEYEPSEMMPVPTEETIVSLSDQVPQVVIADHADGLLLQYVIYVDTRNRSYAV